MDSLIDTFYFLSRNEIEKCQLVSQDWFSTVQKSSNRLPLRHVDQAILNICSPSNFSNYEQVESRMFLRDVPENLAPPEESYGLEICLWSYLSCGKWEDIRSIGDTYQKRCYPNNGCVCRKCWNLDAYNEDPSRYIIFWELKLF